MQNNNIKKKSIPMIKFLGIGILAVVYSLEILGARWDNIKKTIGTKIKTKNRLYKDLANNLEDMKEKSFNIKYIDKKITKEIVDKFLLLKEELVDSHLIDKILTYSLTYEYKESEVFNKTFYMKDMSLNPREMIDNYAFICIKNHNLGIDLLKNEKFIEIVKKNELEHEILSKPLRRNCVEVIYYILNNEELLKVAMKNQRKILRIFLGQYDTLKSEIKEEIKKHNIFSNECIEQEYKEREKMYILGEDIGSKLKVYNYTEADEWLKQKMSQAQMQQLNEKFKLKDTKEKHHKI